MPETMIEAGQANRPQNHPEIACDAAAGTGQGIGSPGPANAVSVGSHPTGTNPHGGPAGGANAASRGIPEKGTPFGVLPLLIGIIEGAKNSIAVISTVLTILRIVICRPHVGA
jgi:hypothetical protein